ncbi:MAG: shikimate dehydrogenase, partial [Gammaproteobacteria bacterium]|nr:shikimate dehydrogenase [Gammaproteobacteria bacterium]
RELQSQRYSGLNVTVPFKRLAWELCDALSPRAEQAGAVNTLSFNADGDIAGDNTDGVGLTRDLVNNLQVEISRRDILVLGAGGAVRGVLGPLLELSPVSLTLANRTPEKAQALARDFADQGNIRAVGFETLGDRRFDLIINGTAAGLGNEVPAIPASAVDADTVCYDMMYNINEATAFVDWALSQGADQAFDGLGMLVEQAAAAFEIWRGVKPDSTAVIKSLRQE